MGSNMLLLCKATMHLCVKCCLQLRPLHHRVGTGESVAEGMGQLPCEERWKRLSETPLFGEEKAKQRDERGLRNHESGRQSECRNALQQTPQIAELRGTSLN